MRLGLLCLVAEISWGFAPPSSVGLRRPQQKKQQPVLQATTTTEVELKPRYPILGLWGGLIAYVAFLAPGHDAAASALDSELLAKVIANPFDPSVSPLFSWIFNAMGLWPVVMLSLLYPGIKDQKVPALPFIVASFGAGVFALAPYVALRESRVDVEPPTGPVGKWLDSTANGVVLAFSVIALSVFTAQAVGGDLGSALTDYKALFDSQLFVHTTSLDFLCLWILSFGIIDEDRQRRGFPAIPATLFACLPLAGPILYLIFRPSLTPDEDDDVILPFGLGGGSSSSSSSSSVAEK